MKPIKKVINLNILYSFINIIIKIVDKFKKTNAVLSPDKNMRTSIKINKIPIKIFSRFVLFSLIIKNANIKGNNRDK